MSRHLQTTAARAWLARYPLEGAPSENVHLVIAGLTAWGEALATQAARAGHYANRRPLGLTLVDEQAGARVADFLRRQPGLASVCALAWKEVSPRDLRWPVLPVAGPEKVTVVFCNEPNEVNIDLARSFANHCPRAVTVIALVSSHPPVVAPEHVELFAAAVAEAEEDDTRAKAIAEYYRQKHGGKPWAELDEDSRDANRAAADHIDIKLRAIGCERVPGADAAVFRFTPAEVELLAEVEHRRWCADRLLHGWTPGPSKDPARKVHPDLKPWEALSEPVREKDREQIRDLPAILAAGGETIRRRTAPV